MFKVYIVKQKMLTRWRLDWENRIGPAYRCLGDKKCLLASWGPMGDPSEITLQHYGIMLSRGYDINNYVIEGLGGIMLSRSLRMPQFRSCLSESRCNFPSLGAMNESSLLPNLRSGFQLPDPSLNEIGAKEEFLFKLFVEKSL